MIRYRINYLKVGIFDFDTKIFNGFWLKSVNFWLIWNGLFEQLDEFLNWNLLCFSSVNGQYQCNLMHCGDIEFIIESILF
jgi:hypothetical protein